ncbi:MAG: DUF3887 domain-containing protein [Candidatus Marinimicrobia bacterium]|nr:DUF3887 domain-containing protein [Candidatus Neomarinimicrobiota bacterium]
MINKEKIWTVLFNPFKYIAGYKALNIGLIIMVLTGLLGFYLDVRFDGLIHIGALKTEWPAMNIFDIFFGWALSSIVFCILLFIFRADFRIIDIFGTLALASYPNIFFVIFTELVLNSSIYIITIVIIPFLVWRLILLYNAIRISSGLNQIMTRVVAFVGYLSSEISVQLLLPIVTSFILTLFPSSAKAQAANTFQSDSSNIVYKNSIREIAEELVISMHNGDFEKSFNYYNNRMKSALNPSKLKNLWQKIEANNGTFQKVEVTRVIRKSGMNLVFVRCKFKQRIVTLQYTFNSNKQIIGFFKC